MRCLALVVFAGCSFQPGSGSDASPPRDGAPDSSQDAVAIDAPEIPIDAPAVSAVAHVPDAVITAFDATASVTFASATIDTGTGANPPFANVTLPSGAHLLTSAQLGGGPELAILEVGDLTVTGTLRVVGGRPLVIIAKTTISVAQLDASATKQTPGGGGYPPRMGSGAGGDGAASGNADSGGGGGGYGTAGGAGQASGAAAAGTAGAVYGTADLATLDGGSGGGTTAPTCTGHPPGAGGGAIQLYAGTSITITGSIHANGGGGAGGHNCSNVGMSGAGGGAGGAIYLQTPQLLGSGLVLAQGGGGGGGYDVASQNNGADGQDGSTTIAAAAGGTATGTGVMGEVNAGGTGGYRDAAPSVFTALSGTMSGNGGGGGGSVGRIVIRSGSAGAVTSSPMAVVVAP